MAVSLSELVKSFDVAISEDEAWALCFQTAQFFLRKQPQSKYQDLYMFKGQALRLDKYGEIVIEKSTLSSGSDMGSSDDGNDNHLANERDAVEALGMAIYSALDYGIGEEEEHELSAELEELITRMTLNEEDNDFFSFCDVAQFCGCHLSPQQDPSVYYKEMCHALRSLLDEKREDLKTHAEKPEALTQEQAQHKWFLQWDQVMQQVRMGVQLKKVEQSVHPQTEFELTPFENLLDDIRSQRYKLHKMMTHAEKPEVLTQEQAQHKLTHAEKPETLTEELAHRRWMMDQVIKQIHTEVRLKKVEHEMLPKVELELTPRETLMKDIKCQRYSLHKAMTHAEKPEALTEELAHRRWTHAEKPEALTEEPAHRKWMMDQVIQQLRTGVKLKKVEHEMLPKIEMELTPHEALMKDIKCQRYSLHKAMDRKLRDPPPQVLSPHQLILEEIRSRPKLRNVAHVCLDESDKTSPDRVTSKKTFKTRARAALRRVTRRLARHVLTSIQSVERARTTVFPVFPIRNTTGTAVTITLVWTLYHLF